MGQTDKEKWNGEQRKQKPNPTHFQRFKKNPVIMSSKRGQGWEKREVWSPY